MEFIHLAQDWEKWRSLVKAKISPVMLVEHILEFSVLQFWSQSSSLKLSKNNRTICFNVAYPRCVILYKCML